MLATGGERQAGEIMAGKAQAARSVFWDLGYAGSGILAASFALKGFLIPNHFFDGGITGITLLLHEVYHVPVAIAISLLNIPFILLGGRLIGTTFAWRMLACVLAFGLCLYLVPFPTVTDDKLLVAIFGGVLMGLGMGLAMRAGTALDGVEVLALYTVERLSFTISEIILGINVIIFLIAALMLGLPTALYSMLTYYAASKTTDFVVEGIEEYTGITIISGQADRIKEMLVMVLSRGITVYKGERGYLPDSFEVHAPVDIIFTVITRLEVRRMRRLVYEIDPKAFIVSHPVKEAAGGVLKRRSHHDSHHAEAS